MKASCWFGENAPPVEWQHGPVSGYGDSESEPGRVRDSTLDGGEFGRTEMKVIRRRQP